MTSCGWYRKMAGIKQIRITGTKKAGQGRNVRGKAKEIDKFDYSTLGRCDNNFIHCEYNTVKHSLEDFMDNNTRGTMIRQGNLMRINNAFVEEASCINNSVGSILVSYSAPERNRPDSIQYIRLNLTGNTVILNSFGQRMCICCLQRGMWVNVIFSSRMTRSIPPQSNAVSVIVQRVSLPPRPPMPPQRPSAVTTGRIILIDFDNHSIVTENPRNINNQTRFLITNSTTITNQFGLPIRLRDLQPGNMVRVTHANFQTPSVLPQTTAFHIQRII